ncbi:nuclear transport factor 2 family protein [Streptomyces sp. NPDC005423]|uniref:nuclear transport factor 2 family protein n=1 Tax=Streptomyces sp. NPDC005423 TaxID=3155343 RepID=UPI0033A2E2F1
MTTTAAPGWASAYLKAVPPAGVDLDPAARFAVEQTLMRYAFALDQRDLTALADVLTEDATWTFTIAGEAQLGPLVGSVAILDFVRAAMDTQTDQRRHNIVNVTFSDADADTVAVRAYLMLTSNAGGSPTIVTTGFYTFTLKRVTGEWRISHLFLGMDNAA